MCALRSGRTERRKTVVFQTFQLAALCAPCVVGARDGAKQQAFKCSNSPRCAPCVVGARDGAKMQALRGYRYKADARPPGATAFPVRRRGVCRRGVYRAAVGVPCRRGCTVPPWVYRAAVGCTVPPWGVPCRRGCTVPPWGVPCRRGVCPARAPRWREHQRRSPHPPSWGLTVVFGV